MQFKIKVSSKMAESESPLGSLEDKLIRMPERLRNEHNIKPGFFLNIKNISGNETSLQVTKAYKSDAEKNNNCVYVSQDTYNILNRVRIESIKPASDVLIGCDPEFFLVDKNDDTIISALQFFPSWGDVGSDGRLAEIRPRPALSANKLTSNIEELIRKAYQRIENRALHRKRDITLIAASNHDFSSAGFHIHFGLPPNMLYNTLENGILMEYIVYIMDYYIGLLSIFPEGSEDYRRRSGRKSTYGKPGNFRWDQLTLEYRVPGGHILRHPILTKGLLSIAIVVVKDILSRIKSYKNENFGSHNTPINMLESYDDVKKLYPRIPRRDRLYEAMIAEKIDPAIKYINMVIDDITQMIGYEDQSENMLPYFKYITRYLTNKYKFSKYMEDNWRLVNEEQSRQVAFL